MSHERDLMNYDRRSAAEIKRDREHGFRKQAEKELLAEGKIQSFCGTDEHFWEKERVVSERVEKLRAKDNLDQAQAEYDRLWKR